MSRATGNRGESLAEEFLLHKGFEILDRQYKFRNGEIDLVARHGSFLIFVEVKTVDLTRPHPIDYGEPEERLTPRKQSFLKRAAEHYLWRREIPETDCRFDLVTVRLREDESDIRHYENAFW